QRVPPEECDRRFIRFTEPLLVRAPKRCGGVELAQAAIHQQAEILVASPEGQRKRLVGELALEDGQALGGRVPSYRVDENGALSEEGFCLAAPPVLASFVIAGRGGKQAGTHRALLGAPLPRLLGSGPRHSDEDLLSQDIERHRSPDRG